MSSSLSFSATCTASATGNWNSTATWSGCTGGNGTPANTPGPADTAIISTTGRTVTIPAGLTVTVNTLNVSAGTLTSSSTGTFTVTNVNLSGTGLITSATTGAYVFTSLSMSGGTLTHTTNNLTLTNFTQTGGTFNARRTLLVNGSTNLNAGSIVFGTTGSKTFVGTVTVAGGTWNNAANEGITLRGGFTANSGTITPGTAIYTFNTNASQSLGGSLTYSLGRISVSSPVTLTVSGNVAATTSTTIAAGATLVNNGIFNARATTVSAGAVLTNTGTLTATNLAATGRVNNNSGTISATGTTTVALTTGALINASGATYTAATLTVNNTNTSGLALLNNGNITVSTSLGGTGAFNQQSGGSLAINGTYTITTLNASCAVGANNTVTYQNTTTQTIKVATYCNLNLVPTASAVYTLPSLPAAIGGNLSIGDSLLTPTGSVTASANTSLIVNGATTINPNATFIAPAAGNLFRLLGNFTVNGTFTNNTGTVTFNGSSAQSISSATAIAFNSLTLSNASGLVLNQSINVNAVLTFTSGVISTSSNQVNLGASGSVSRTSGHVDGNFQKNISTGASVVRSFEVGTGSSYTPLTLTFTSVSSAGNLLVKSNVGDHPQISSSNLNSVESLNRYWTLNNSGIAFASYAATFNYLSGSPADHDNSSFAANYEVQRYDVGAGSWSNTNLSGSPTTTAATITGVTSLGASGSAFALGRRLAQKLNFLQEPVTSVAGASIAPAITVRVEDSNGTLVPWATSSVTLVIDNNAGTPAGTLSGTVTVNAISGVATFSNLSINKTGVGYTLSASSGSLTADVSSAFNITPGAASKLVFLQAPSNTGASVVINPTVTIRIEDANSNLVTSATNTVTMAIGTNGGSPAGSLSGTLSVAAVAGVASFSTLSINNSGNYTLVASSGALTSATSSTFQITSNILFITQQPSSAVAGANVSPAITVEIRDLSNNLVSTATDTVTVAILNNAGSPAGTLGGTLSQNASGGIATFNNLNINKTGVGYTLQFTATNISSVTSTAFNISAGVATKLAILQQPTNTVAGASISPAVTARVLDVNDNLVTTATNTVTMSIGTNPGSGTLSGTTSVNAVSGVATFSNLSINKTGTGYTLAAASTGLTSIGTTAFNVTPGVATRLSILQQPTNAIAGALISPAITVRVEDANNNLVTSATNLLSFAIGTNPGSGTLSGTTSVSAVSGVATFSTLSINKSGTGYTLIASAVGLTSATSTAFNISAGAATKLAILQQPTNSVAGASISPAVTARVLDTNDNLVTTATNTVTMSIGTNPGSGTLSGTTSVSAVSGVATFSNLSINKAGTGYTLVAASTGLTSTITSSFNITPGAAAQLSFVQQPVDTTAATVISPSVTVQVEDAFGNFLSTATNSISIAILNNAGSPPGTLSGTLTVSAVGGTATFSTLSINKSGAGYTLRATSVGLTARVSDPFEIFAGTPTKLSFLQHPTNALPNASITPSITVRVEDANSNLVDTASNNIVLAIGTNPGGGTLSGTLTIAASSGIATFSNISINQSGVGYTLNSTSTGLTGATSNSFNISASICTSVTTGNWNTAATWSCGRVPLSTDAVVIATGTSVTVDVNTAAIDSLVVDSGASLEGNGTNTLTIDGAGTAPDLTNNGSIDFSGANKALLRTTSAALDIFQAPANPSVWNLNQIDFNSLGATIQNISEISFEGPGNPFLNTTAPITGTLNCTWNFVGASTQSITSSNIAQFSVWNQAGSLNNFSISNTSGLQLDSSLSITGNLDVVGDGVLTLAGTSASMPSVGVSSSKTFSSTSTVNYQGTSTQIVSAENYGNLNILGGSTKTLASGTTQVSGDFSLAPATIFNGSLNNPNLNLQGDFSNSGTFNFAGTGTLSFTGSGNQSVTGATTASRVVVNNTSAAPGGVTLNNDFTISSLLTFTNGRLLTGANKVILSSGASVSGAGVATGWVAGNLQKFIPAGSSTTSFEVGTNGAAAPSLAYTPMSTSFSGVTASGGSLIAFSSVGEHPQLSSSGLDPTKSVNRVYSLTTAGVTGTSLPSFTSYDPTFNYVSADTDVGLNNSNVITNRWTGSSWSPPSGIGVRTSSSAQALGVVALGEFALGAPVPLDLIIISNVISDPTNLTSNPKRIPGAIVEYTLTATNNMFAAATVTNATISNILSSDMTYLPNSLVVDGVPEDDDASNGGTSNPDVGNYNASLLRVSGNVGSIAPNSSKVLKYRVTIE